MKMFELPCLTLLYIIQKTNPVVRHFRNITWEVRDIVPDYILGKTCCALFLRYVLYKSCTSTAYLHFDCVCLSVCLCVCLCSVRYHVLHPEYIHARLQQLGKAFDTRVLLLLVDTVSKIAHLPMHVCGCDMSYRSQTDYQQTLQEVTKVAILSECTLMVAWR